MTLFIDAYIHDIAVICRKEMAYFKKLTTETKDSGNVLVRLFVAT